MDVTVLGGLTEPGLLILASLAAGPKHGYAMVADIESCAQVRLGPGTLYGTLARLERYGWIAPLPTTDRRQPYEVTAAGFVVLRAELTRLQHFMTVAQARVAQP